MTSITPNIAFNAIQSTVLEDVTAFSSVPLWIQSTVNWLQRTNISVFYRTYKITTYINPRDAVLAGGAIYSGAKVLGLSHYLKIAIYIKCALELFEKYEKLSETFHSLKDAYYFRYPAFKMKTWELENATIWPAFKIWWETSAVAYQKQIAKVIVCVWHLFVEIFKLGFYLRDLYLLTQNDPTIEFYACSDLANQLNQDCNDLEKNLSLVVEQFRSREALGNRLIRKIGFEKDMSTSINNFIKENPQLLKELNQQVEGFKEDSRTIFGTGAIRISIGKHRRRLISQERFVPYLGQPKVDQYFHKKHTRI